MIGEDLSFCASRGALGIPVYVHTGVQTTHLKRVWLAEEQDFGQVAWAQLCEVPAATEETAVVVPVLGRPQHAAPFMASLARRARRWPGCTRSPTRMTWDGAGVGGRGR